MTTPRHPNALRQTDDLSIGWQPRLPSGHAKAVSTIAIAMLIGALVIAGSVAVSLKPHQPGTFEFGNIREVSGTFYAQPVPLLLLDEAIDEQRSAVLTGLYKWGVDQRLLDLHGQRVSLRGTAIRHPERLMIEVTEPDSVAAAEGTATPLPAALPVGEVALVGELVDTKCFFGVMRPGQGKVHRACAVRCLSGGIPPGLLLRTADGRGTVVMLTDDHQQPATIDPELAARELHVSGALAMVDGIPMLAVSDYRLVE